MTSLYLVLKTKEFLPPVGENAVEPSKPRRETSVQPLNCEDQVKERRVNVDVILDNHCTLVWDQTN